MVKNDYQTIFPHFLHIFPDLIKLHTTVKLFPPLGDSSEFMGKTFQAAQLTHERFLTIDHSCKICF